MHIYGRTDPGKVRVNNEDSFAVDIERGIAVLADGMGGLNAGEVASACAVETVIDGLRQQVPASQTADPGTWLKRTMEAAFRAANRAVIELAASTPRYRGMGTTLVATQVWQDLCLIGHVGDSRVYRFRADRLQRLTTDHSVVQQLVEAGVMTDIEARKAPNRHIITRAIGLEPEVRCDLRVGRLLPGDLLLLCTDGLTDLLDDAAIGRHCRAFAPAGEAAGRGLPHLVDMLVAAALDRGGIDNVTVIALSASGASGASGA